MAADQDERLMKEAREGLVWVEGLIDRLERRIRWLWVLAMLLLVLCVITLARDLYRARGVAIESAEYDYGGRRVILWLRELPTGELPQVHLQHELGSYPSVSLKRVALSADGRHVYIRLSMSAHQQGDIHAVFAIRPPPR